MGIPNIVKYLLSRGDVGDGQQPTSLLPTLVGFAQGRVMGVDASCVLHSIAMAHEFVEDVMLRALVDGAVNEWRRFLKELVSVGISPYVVFDGRTPYLPKAATNAARNAKRQVGRATYDDESLSAAEICLRDRHSV
jgi:hypothetical protein